MRILHLEDDPHDAELIHDSLSADFRDLEITLVGDRQGFTEALQRGGYDLILSDFNLPGFNGHQALAMARAARPDVPVIFISGTIGEDTAAEVVRSGAADYLLKDRMQRLPLAMRHALKQREEQIRRQQAEQQIREQAELLDKVQDGIVVSSLSNRVLYWNKGAERIFGWSADEVIGRTTAELFGAIAEPTLRTMQEHLDGSDEWRGELSLGNKTNRPLMAELRVTVVRDTLGQARSRLSIITDITERKQLEEQLMRAHRLESLGMLSAGIAHDLNNALAPMLMVGGLLRPRISDPDDLRLIDLLEQSAQRGAALVRQIVSFAGARSRERVAIPPKHLLRDILQLVQDTFAKSIRFEHNIPNGLWSIRGDPTQLHQVLLNLCINARDAMPEGGLLRLSAENRTVAQESAAQSPGAIPGRFVMLEVADTGTGIAPDVLPHIWEPFFTTKAEGKGTGLGLSTVRGIVANHGGFVTAESPEGQGAVFRVFLPADVETSEVSPDRASLAPAIPRGHGEMIVVVDDQPSIRESIGVVLTKYGYRPMVAGDGIEALTKYANRMRDVSLVISDLDMPGLDGVSFSEAILRLNPALKILFISGTGDGEATRDITATTKAEFMPKPFSPEALLTRVAKLLGATGGSNH